MSARRLAVAWAALALAPFVARLVASSRFFHVSAIGCSEHADAPDGA